MSKKSDLTRITFRVTELEREEIQRRAKTENKSVNQYLKDSAMGVQHANDKIKSEVMKHLIDLQLSTQNYHTFDDLRNHILDARVEMLRKMGAW